MKGGKVLIYLFRRDLRVSDNPVLHHLATSHDHGFSHLLPVYVFPAHQIEVSGFVKDGEKSPYPQALSLVGKFWRCGPHRARFAAQSVWDLKDSLEDLGSGLVLRTGSFVDVLKQITNSLQENSQTEVGAVWMTEEISHEEIQEQNAVSQFCSERGVDFKLWPDEKYLVDDRDTGLRKDAKDLPDVFTSYRKSQEPLRERPRHALPRPKKGSLPPLPEHIPPPQHPFTMASSLEELETRLVRPVKDGLLDNPPTHPEGAKSAHPFQGGESTALKRLKYLLSSGGMTSYKETRNGLIGTDFSTKLSAYLASGCISARQIHEELCKFEDGKEDEYASGTGYGDGENEGTKAVRFELLWRDYMHLCTKKFGSKLFRRSGFREDESYKRKWVTADERVALKDQDPSPEKVGQQIQRFFEGTTGMGLIDASQRELYHTGYTSNRARQNVASFFAKHLTIDWRYGAEWYEMMLVDYDVSSNWSNWQYVAGVGNDPRGDARIFNPVKQAFDYDKDGTYVRTWVPEVKDLIRPENIFQVCTASEAELEEYGLKDNIMVTDPIKRIEFTVAPKSKPSRRPYPRRGGGFGRGGRRGGGGGGGGGNTGVGFGPRNGALSSNMMSRNWTNGLSMSGGTRSFTEGSSDSVNGRQNQNHATPPGRGSDFQSYRGNGAPPPQPPPQPNGPFPGTFTGSWTGSYDNTYNPAAAAAAAAAAANSSGAYSNGFANMPTYTNGAAWQGAWAPPTRAMYSNFRGTNGPSWGQYDGGTGGGYQGPSHYIPASAYLQMPPYIGPAT